MKEQPIQNQVGFNFALYLTPPRNNDTPNVKDLEDGIDKLALGLSLEKNVSSMELNKHPSELKKYINKDLLQKLEESSPLKLAISSKQMTNTSIFQMNDNAEKDLDNSDLISHGISNCNMETVKKNNFDFSDERIDGNFDMKPIKMNFFEQVDVNRELIHKDDETNSISTNIPSKYSSFSSPNYFGKDLRPERKSFTAENKTISFNDNPNKNSMFNLSSQGLSSENYLVESKKIRKIRSFAC